VMRQFIGSVRGDIEVQLAGSLTSGPSRWPTGPRPPAGLMVRRTVLPATPPIRRSATITTPSAPTQPRTWAVEMKSRRCRLACASRSGGRSLPGRRDVVF